MLPSSWLFCCCSHLPNIATLFYIKLILKALFCIQKTRKNIKKRCDKTFKNHTHEMIKLKGMRNDNVNEKMTNWAQGNKEPKMVSHHSWVSFMLLYFLFILLSSTWYPC